MTYTPPDGDNQPSPFDGHDVPESLRPQLRDSAGDLAAFRRLCAAMAAGDVDAMNRIVAEVEQLDRAPLVLLVGAMDMTHFAQEVLGNLAERWLSLRAVRQLDAAARAEGDDD